MGFKFERFDAWRRGIALADDILEVADGLPQQYQFSLGEQLRRAAISIPTNLAEGSGRDNPNERAYLYSVAKGSVYEVVSLLVIAGKRDHITHNQYRMLRSEADELAAMIHGAITACRR